MAQPLAEYRRPRKSMIKPVNFWVSSAVASSSFNTLAKIFRASSSLGNSQGKVGKLWSDNLAPISWK